MPNDRTEARRARSPGRIALAVALAVLAIVVVVQTWNTLGTNEAVSQSRQQVEQLEERLSQREALLRLNALRTQIREGTREEALRIAYEAIRAELERVYPNAGIEAVRGDLEDLRMQILEQDPAALETIDQIVMELGGDLGP